MANLPTRPPVAQAQAPVTATPVATLVSSTPIAPLPSRTPRSFIESDFSDWDVAVATSLSRAVPADVNKTIITLHKHEIVIERQDFLYRSLTTIENALIIASSVFLMGISAASVLFALGTMAITL